MYRDQLVCVIAEVASDADAVERRIVDARQAFDRLLRASGFIHYASLCLLPPAPGAAASSSVWVALELVLDGGHPAATVIETLVDADFALLSGLFDPQGAMDAAQLKQRLKKRVRRAHGGFVGARDRTVKQIVAEGALRDKAQALAATLPADGHQAQVADAFVSAIGKDPVFDALGPMPPRSPWRAPDLTLPGRIWKIVTGFESAWLPDWIARVVLSTMLVAVVLYFLTTIGAIAVFETALAAGGALDKLAPWMGQDLRIVELAVGAVAITFVVTAIVMLVNAEILSVPAAAAGLLLAAVVAVIQLARLSHDFPTLTAFLHLIRWGLAACVYLASVFVSLALLFVTAMLVVPREWGQGSVWLTFIVTVVTIVGLFGPFYPALCIGIVLALLVAVYRVVRAAIAVVVDPVRRPVIIERATLVLLATAIVVAFGALIHPLTQQATNILPDALDLTAALAKPHWRIASLGFDGFRTDTVAALLWLATAIAAAMMLKTAALTARGRGTAIEAWLNRPDHPSMARRIASWARGVELTWVGRSAMQQTHASLLACEASLRTTCNHMTSVTEVRRPYWLYGGLLRVWLWLISALGHMVFVDGLLGFAKGIHFAHWYVFDDGRRFLFLSNYDGDFSGYLDEFIRGAYHGINSIWGHTELRARGAAIAARHPAVARDRTFPPRRLVFFAGCSHEQWFKSYVRESMIPHAYRFEAYRYSLGNIEQATRLRESLVGPRDEVGDDRIMRAIES